MNEVLKELGIFEDGEYTNSGAYEVTIDDSDTYGKYYSKLNKNPDVEEMEDNALLTFNEGRVLYRYKEYLLDLQGDFNNDIYKLVITKER